MTSVKVEGTYIEVGKEKITFVMRCNLISGGVDAGSLLRLTYGDGIDMTIPVDYVAVDESGAVTIGVACDDESDAEFLDGLDLVGELLAADD